MPAHPDQSQQRPARRRRSRTQQRPRRRWRSARRYHGHPGTTRYSRLDGWRVRFLF